MIAAKVEAVGFPTTKILSLISLLFLSNDPQNPSGLSCRPGSVPGKPVADELSRWDNGLNLGLRKTALQEGYLGMSFGVKPLRTQIRGKSN